MATMMYNAVVKHVPGKGDTDGGQEIGRVYLEDLALIPERWTILFRGARISHNADIGELLCSATDPITIYKGFVPPAVKFHVVVHALTGKTTRIETHTNETVEELKTKIWEIDGIPEHHQRLIFDNKQLEDGRTLMNYKISDKCDVYMVLNLRGGGFLAQDVEANQLRGLGGTTNKLWKAYSRGMNLYGLCPNGKCKSRRNGQRKRVSLRAGYGTILLTAERSTFKCPACMETSGNSGNIIGLVPISQFVLACGRAIFRFKKSGVGQQVKTVVMESLGSFLEYKTFDEKGGKSEYDFIEITTVGTDKSFYYCHKCDMRIRERSDEVVMECDHTYHAQCAGSMSPRCLVCKATSFSSVYDLLGFDIRNTHEKVAFVSKRV